MYGDLGLAEDGGRPKDGRFQPSITTSKGYPREEFITNIPNNNVYTTCWGGAWQKSRPRKPALAL
jgi:hypothetical protein